jgi:hypothetical protein
LRIARETEGEGGKNELKRQGPAHGDPPDEASVGKLAKLDLPDDQPLL